MRPLWLALFLFCSACWSEYTLGRQEVVEVDEPPLSDPGCDDGDCDGVGSALESCEGRLPKPLVTPMQLSLERLPGESCGQGASDAFGVMALSAVGDRSARSRLFNAKGELAGNSSAPVPKQLIEQFMGFKGVLHASATPLLLSMRQDASTHLARALTPSDEVMAIGRYPEGVLLASRAENVLSFQALDGEANPVWSSSVEQADPPIILATERSGMTLVLFTTHQDGRRQLRGRWLDNDGKPGDAFVILARIPEETSYALFARVSEGFYIREEWPGTPRSSWVAEISRGAVKARRPPLWLRARTNSRLGMAFNASMFVFIPNAGAQLNDCTQRMELVTPGGTSCASVSFVAGAGACTTGFITVGYDGSVMQNLPNTCPEGAACQCEWQVWPAQLGRPAPR